MAWLVFFQSWYSCHVLLLKRVHARGGGKRPPTAQLRSSGRGVPPPNGGELRSSGRGVPPPNGGELRSSGRGVPPPNGGELRSSGRGGAPPNGASSALSLLIIINLRFFAMGGADIIIGFTRSYDSGLCCFIGSIILRGSAPNDGFLGGSAPNDGSNAVRIDCK